MDCQKLLPVKLPDYLLFITRDGIGYNVILKDKSLINLFCIFYILIGTVSLL